MSSGLRTLRVAAARPYTVRIGTDALLAIGGDADVGSQPQLISEAHVLELHRDRLPRAWIDTALLIPRGEDAKTWRELGSLLELLLARGLDRDSTLIAFGGGAVCDTVGLAAALFMRGIRWIACPTTLLAQVDASVGGKTAVNLNGSKNAIGSFHQPAAVAIDPRVLLTLDDTEYASGLGELLKHALLAGELDWLERQADGLLARDVETLVDVVERSVAFKAEVVAADEREHGLRAKLNLGHTFAHAIETVAGHGRVAHGAAVSAGIGLALDLARELGLSADPELPARTATLQRRLGLPTGLSGLGLELDREALLAAMSSDKKSKHGRPRFVVPRTAGDVELGVAVDSAVLRRVLSDA